MSFSSQVKNEISKIELTDNNCVLCEISAAIRYGGHFRIQDNGYVATLLVTENPSFARRIIKSTVHNFNLHPSLIVNKSKKLKGHIHYQLELIGTHVTRIALGDMGFLKLDENQSGVFSNPEEIMGKECCLRSFIRGAFLMSGSVNHPEKSYHLEMSSHNEREINRLCKILNELSIKAKVIERKNLFVCYVKEAESIADFLNIIGAHNALMKYENVRIVKGIRNNVNRVVNFESANLDKIVNATGRHVDNIKYIKEKVGLRTLDERLAIVADLRVEYPHISLSELGTMMSPPLGKSGVNHRLKKIDEIADQLRRNQS